MKRALIVIFSISIMFITGCNGATGYNVKQTNLELSVMIDGLANFELNNIMEVFQATYPDITLVNYYPPVSYENEENEENLEYREELMKKTATEILAGRGPDIYVIDRTIPFFDDINKSIKGGAFYDINNILKSNKNYDRNNYIEAAMKACELDGKLHIFPTSIYAPILVTTKEIVEDTGIDLNNLDNYFNFMNELDKYHKISNLSNQRASIVPLFNFNLELLNAYDDTVSYNTDKVRQAIQIYKECENNSSKLPMTSGIDDSHIGLFNYDKIIFSDRYFGFEALELCARLNEKFDPIMVPKRNSKGQIQTTICSGLAVNPNSPNMDNVAKFFDLVLTNDQQTNYLDNEKLKDYPGYADEYGDIPQEERYIYANLRNSIPTDKSRISKELALREKQYNDGYIYNNRDMKKSLEITPLSSDYYTQFYDICENIEVCTLPTGVPAQVYNYFLPYFKDEITLDEAIKTAQSAMEIYISE